MITQTLALLLDAYRELNSRKLFWIVLVLSVLVVGAMAAVGNDENGLTLLAWDIPAPMFSTAVIPRDTFYKLIFFSLGLQLWLTWAATILALISTAGIIPDFVSSGTVELTLSRPIGRGRLLLTKYAGGLLFALLQVSLFSAACFLVIGFRGGAWEPAIFLAIPLVVLFFSYIYCVCALVGLVTRSAVTALLVAGLFWFLIFLVQSTERVFLQFRIRYEQAALVLEGDADALSRSLDAAEPDRRARIEASLADVRARLEPAQSDAAMWRRLHAWADGAMTALPKTGQTMEILKQRLLSMSEMGSIINATTPGDAAFEADVHGVRVSPRTVARETERAIRAHTPAWVIGTSLAFEAAVLALAVAIFRRRDY